MLKQFQSDTEPTTQDAIWTAIDIFKVAVFDDGASRNGYASYVCNILSEHDFKGKGVWVQVIDMGTVLRKETWKNLGEAYCP